MKTRPPFSRTGQTSRTRRDRRVHAIVGIGGFHRRSIDRPVQSGARNAVSKLHQP